METHFDWFETWLDPWARRNWAAPIEPTARNTKTSEYSTSVAPRSPMMRCRGTERFCSMSLSSARTHGIDPEFKRGTEHRCTTVAYVRTRLSSEKCTYTARARHRSERKGSEGTEKSATPSLREQPILPKHATNPTCDDCARHRSPRVAEALISLSGWHGGGLRCCSELLGHYR